MNPYDVILEKLRSADAVLIAASNGLSITEGLHLFAGNEAFLELFGDFQRRYGVRNILEGCFTRFPSEEVKWAWWSRLIWHYSGNYSPTPVMKQLKALVQDKPYFVITSNGEGHFQLAGFDPERVYEVEGSWAHMQCSRACHPTLYPVKERIRAMAERECDGRVPSELVPRCPVCGAPMNIHVAADDSFLPDEAAQDRFQRFVQAYHTRRLVVLELGVGARNRMLKAPLMRFVGDEPNAFYVAFNKGEVYLPPWLEGKSIGVDGGLAESFDELTRRAGASAQRAD